MRKIKLVIASLILVSPFAANADIYEITAVGIDYPSDYATDFSIVYDDTSGDGLFQVDELLYFSGFSLFVKNNGGTFLCEEVAPDIIHGSPDLPGISTASGAGTSGTNGYTSWVVEIVTANCGFGPGAFGFGFNFWTYSVRTISTSAGELTVTYEGEVTSTVGAGFGYAVGDPISGSFTFNTEDLVDVNGDGSYLESAGPVSSSQSAVVEIYPENLDRVDVWNFEQNGYDQFSIGDATLQSGSPTSFTIWHAISMWDFSELFDLENLPAGGLSFSDSDVEYMGGNISHRIRDLENRETVEDQLARFDLTSIHIGVASTPIILLEQLEATVTGAGPGDSFANKIVLAQTYLEVPDEESACQVLSAFLNQVRAQRGKKLTEEQADQFTADAVAIMDAVGCD